MTKTKDEITPKEWEALLLTATGLSDHKAYKKMFPNAKASTTKSQASRYFRRVRAKLTTAQELEIYNLARNRFYQVLDESLKAETHIFTMGVESGTVPDNAIRFKALELLGKMHGITDGGEKEVIDNKIEIVFTDRTGDDS